MDAHNPSFIKKHAQIVYSVLLILIIPAGIIANTVIFTSTGLGLWITRQLVELMNGKITIDSIQGVGTQVTLAFPIVAAKNKKK